MFNLHVSVSVCLCVHMHIRIHSVTTVALTCINVMEKQSVSLTVVHKFKVSCSNPRTNKVWP